MDEHIAAFLGRERQGKIDLITLWRQGRKAAAWCAFDCRIFRFARQVGKEH